MIHRLCIALAIALGATPVVAQQNPILARQEIMKKSDDDARLLSKMYRGEERFDAAKVASIYAAMEEGYKKVQGLFPDDSKTGEKTRASPKIWENRADFDAKLAAFIKTATEAKAKATNEEGFKAVHTVVTKACDTCHADYRMRRQPG